MGISRTTWYADAAAARTGRVNARAAMRQPSSRKNFFIIILFCDSRLASRHVEGSKMGSEHHAEGARRLEAHVVCAWLGQRRRKAFTFVGNHQGVFDIADEYVHVETLVFGVVH